LSGRRHRQFPQSFLIQFHTKTRPPAWVQVAAFGAHALRGGRLTWQVEVRHRHTKVDLRRRAEGRLLIGADQAPDPSGFSEGEDAPNV
jgi:hypothetical protein